MHGYSHPKVLLIEVRRKRTHVKSIVVGRVVSTATWSAADRLP
jgi:hypothetical protein